MIDVHSLGFEPVNLQNRLGRFVDVDVCCVNLGPRYILILQAAKGVPAALIAKNAEHFAFQLREKLDVSPEQLDFLQVSLVDTDQGEEQQWLRWRFHWAGNTPLKGRCETLSEKARKGMVWSQVNSEEINLHRFTAQPAAVA